MRPVHPTEERCPGEALSEPWRPLCCHTWEVSGELWVAYVVGWWHLTSNYVTMADTCKNEVGWGGA